MENKTIGFALCGSFCTHDKAMQALEAVRARYAHVIPIVSETVAANDTRFGNAHDLMREMERICDHRVIATMKAAEPIGPQKLLDVLVICSEDIESLCLVRCYPIGVMYMLDNGANDEKIIAIPYNDPMYNIYTDIEQLPSHIFEEIQHFFSIYKDLEQKETAVKEFGGPAEAIEVIEQCIANYNKVYGSKK